MLRGPIQAHAAFVVALTLVNCAPSTTATRGGGGGTAGAGGSETAGANATAGTTSMGSTSGGGAGVSSGGSAGAATAGSGPSGSQRIVVSAGEHARQHSIVSFALANASGQSFALEDEEGQSQSLPVQVSDGTAVFILPELAAGQERSYALAAFDTAAPAAITSTVGDSDVTLAIADSKLVRFQGPAALPNGVAAVYQRGGYLHPLYSPSGVIVTDDYPASHIHHHGIWSAWTRAQFNGHAIDFWNMADGLGKVDFAAFGKVWQGPVHAGFEAELVHIDLVGAEPVTALTESWQVTGYKTHDAPAPYLVFDLASVQRTATAMPVALEEYIYGGFGIRGPEEWLDKTKVSFLTSEGADRATGDATAGRWLYMGGTVGGKLAGYAVLSHPENFRAPQPFRIHPDEPYASLSPVKAGAFSIEPGSDYVTRFRIVTLDGAPDAALLDALWNDYATPASVRVE